MVNGLSKLESQTLIRRLKWMAYITIAYNVVEGTVSILFGAADDSVALLGFGIDSFIEVASAAVVLWRFVHEVDVGSTPLDSEREKNATKVIGFLFLILAAVVFIFSSQQILTLSHPVTTLPGLLISALSLTTMLFLWSTKLKAAKKLGSTTALNDASCTLACIKLSAVLFAGSLIYLVVPKLWWIDSAAAIALAVFIAQEGWGIVRNKGCSNCSCAT